MKTREPPFYAVSLGAKLTGKTHFGQAGEAVFGLPNLSLGEFLRRTARTDGSEGRTVAQALARKVLVDDDLLMELLRRELARPRYRRGANIDGAPKTRLQVDLILGLLADFGGTINLALIFTAAPEVILGRADARVVCTGPARHSWNLRDAPPPTSGVCGLCGSSLIKREDDGVVAVTRSLRFFQRRTLPAVRDLEKRGIEIVTVDTSFSLETARDKYFTALAATLYRHRLAKKE